jgi:hypothetical protein
MQRCVPASAFQHLCSSICVSASVCQHLRLCFSFYVPASLVRVDILDCSITDCHQWHSLTVFVISCVAAFVSVFQQLCSSICVSASVLQHLCFSIYVSASVFQHLCFSICLLASMFQHLCSSTCVCSISNRLPSMTILDPVFVISCVAAFVSVFSICVPTSRLCSACSSMCFSICVPASVFHLCSSVPLCVPAFVFQHLCFSFCVPASLVRAP